MENLDIFNLDPSLLLNPKKVKSSDLFYKPDPEKGKDGVYKALVRFVPNIFNTSLPKVQKYYIWLTDPGTGKSMSVDCPSTVQKPSILKDIYWKLINSNSAADKELAEKFSRKEDYYAIIQVVKDQNQPDLEGKLMLYKFPGKINQLLEAQIKPEFGDGMNPSDPFEGKLLGLHVRKVGKWNNYDLCSFIGEKCPIIIDGVKAEKTNEGAAKVIEYLKTGPKNLEDFKYKEWDEDTTAFVMNAIKNTIPNGRIVSEISSGVNNKPNTSTPAPEKNEVEHDFFAGSSTSSNNEHYNEIKNTKVVSDNSAETKREAPKSTASSSLDDLYNDL